MQLAKWNMGAYDLLRMDILLRRCHDLHIATKHMGPEDAPSADDFKALIICADALEHAYVVFKWAFLPEGRKSIDNKFEKIRLLIREHERKGKINDMEYNELRDRLFVIIDYLYHAKQNVNLGIPMEKFKGGEEKIREAMEQ